MSQDKIRLGFVVGSGEEYFISPSHPEISEKEKKRRERISLFMRNNHLRRGKHNSKESIEKMKNSEYHKNLKGRSLEDRCGSKERADEWRKNLSDAAKKVKKKPLSETHKENIRKSMLNNPKIKNRQLRLWKDKDYAKMMSDSAIKKWKNPKYKEEQIKATLKALLVRPTSYEKKISELCIENNLPFIYTGDGTFLIGHKNPDFVDKQEKIAIEVYHDYFKIRDFGSCEEYEKQRSAYFEKYGWKTIFIRTNDIENKKWKEICIEKIIGGCDR